MKDAGRLDLAVESRVVDESKPYHGLFSPEAVEAARKRLAEHGGQPGTAQSAGAPAMPPPTGSVSIPALAPGSSFDIHVTVGRRAS